MIVRDLEKMIWQTYADWQGLLANPRIARTRKFVSWSDRESLFVPSDPEAEDVVALAERGQYSFQVAGDGSMFQLYYEVDDNGREVVAAKLAFFGIRESPMAAVQPEESPDAERSETEAETESEVEAATETREELETDRVLEPGPEDMSRKVSWLRLDYSPAATKGVIHSCCHLHVGGFPDGRLIVKGLPSPAQFVEFTMHLAYPDIFEVHRLDDTGHYRDASALRAWNTPVLPMQAGPAETLCTHLRIAGA